MKHSLRLSRSILILATTCLALAPLARAVEPPPDGGYPGHNTAEGKDALFHVKTNQGIGHTAVGNRALFSTKSGGLNVGVGLLALYDNTDGQYNTAVGA